MSNMLPRATIDCFRQFNDLTLDSFGITCTLYIPNNLTSLESQDMYTSPDSITYTKYEEQQVWFEWYAKDIVKLRKSGVFAENDPPITARFKISPEVTINSYFTLPTRFMNNQYGTIDFECVDVITQHISEAEVYRRFKCAPLRKK